MAAHHNGAAAPRVVAPAESDNAAELWSRAAPEAIGEATNLDSAKALTGPLARLALLGIEARHLHHDVWALIASTGATIGIVRGAEALAAAAAGFEAVQADVLRTLQQIGGAA